MTNEKPLSDASPMHRHLPEVIWYQLMQERADGIENGKIHRMKWLFKAEDFPCGNPECRRTETIKFMVLPTGVYRSCSYEGFTEKIEPVDEGEMHCEAKLLEDIILTDNDDAVEVIKRYKQERIFLNEDSHISLPQYKLPKRAVRKSKKVEE
jgi:hypothetical protein